MVDILLCNQAMVPIPLPIQVHPSAPVAREEMDAIYRSCPFYQAVTNGWMTILKMLIDAQPGEICSNCTVTEFQLDQMKFYHGLIQWVWMVGKPLNRLLLGVVMLEILQCNTIEI